MDRARETIQRLVQYLIELNYFQSLDDSEQSLRHQRWSTRLYILLLSGSVLILILYSGFSGNTTAIQVNSPSLDVYRKLQNKYGAQLQCSCSQIVIPYRKFVQLEASFHAVCASHFVRQQWIDYLFNGNISRYFAVDFREAATGQFQMLAELCRTATDAVDNKLDEFYSKELIHFHLLDLNIFDALVQASVSELRATISNTFSQTLKVVRATTFGNQLVSGFGSNAIFVIYEVPEKQKWYVALRAGFYYGSNEKWCYCTNSVTCNTNAAFYNFMAGYDTHKYYSAAYTDPQAYVDGWKAGCFPIESVLLSSIRCLYNVTCLDLIQSFIDSSMRGNFTALNTSMITRFSHDIILNSLVQELFMEVLEANVSYESYFTECRPSFCLYLITKYRNILTTATTILGLYGGLTVILRLIVPYLIKALSRLRRSTQIPENTEQRPNFSLCAWIRTGCHRLIYSLKTLNLFSKPLSVNSPDELYNQRLSTRFYIVLLVLSLVVLFSYTSVEQRNQTIQVYSPSLDTYERLKKLARTALRCPCAQLTMPYGAFLQLTYSYHSVCTSDFVSEKWINWLLNAQIYEPSLYFADFRITSSTIFQMLADYCILSSEIVDEARRLFYETKFISAQLVTRSEFALKMKNEIAQFQLRTPNRFLRVLNFIRNMTHVNQPISWSRQNIDIRVSNHTKGQLTVFMKIATLQDTNGMRCSCAVNSRCKQPQGFFERESFLETYNATVFIPGFFAACFPVESLLQSTLECFYNPICLETIRSYVMSRLNVNRTVLWNFTALDADISSRFPPNTTIELIVNSLFVESWFSNTSYALYYSKCRPLSCAYTAIKRSTIAAVITVIVGVFGGLCAALQFIIPFAIKFIRRQRRAVVVDNLRLTETSLANRITRGITQLRTDITHLVLGSAQKLYQKLVQLNLFEKVHTARNEYEIRFERWTTRLYIVLLYTTCFITLILYTTISVQPTTIQFNIPSTAAYHDLQSAYGTAIVCTCSQISTPYKKFVYVQPSFHQICSSGFTKQQWINFLFDNINITESLFSSRDFRVNCLAQFQALLALCELADQAVNDELSQFLETSIVSTHLIPFEEFTLRIQSAINLFRMAVPRIFLRTMKLVRGANQGNALISAYTSNWRLTVFNNSNYTTIYTEPLKYDECVCATSPFCIQSAVIDDWIVPGFQVGCSPVESLLRSTLECLYDAVCLDNMTLAILNSSVTFNTLQPTVATRFAPHTILNDIVENLFIESWITNISFDNYFAECQFSTCTYTISYRQNIIFIITTLVGLYGGLTVAFRLLTPIILSIVRKLMELRRKTRTAPAPVSTIVENCSNN